MADASDVPSEGKSAIGLEQLASEQHKATVDSASTPNATALVCRSSAMVLRKSPGDDNVAHNLAALTALSSEPIKVKTVDENDGAGL